MLKIRKWWEKINFNYDVILDQNKNYAQNSHVYLYHEKKDVKYILGPYHI